MAWVALRLRKFTSFVEFLERDFILATNYNNLNGFNKNKNASFFFVSIETPYRMIGFLLKSLAMMSRASAYFTYLCVFSHFLIL